jgi:type IV pilus assembly protein PilZ
MPDKKTRSIKKDSKSKKSATGPATASRSASPVKLTRDNRSGHRIPIQLLVDYRSGGTYLFDFCRDLGTGGVFIETKTPLTQGSSVDLTFTIPDSKETLEAKGQVIWVQDFVSGREDLVPGMGVQFSAFTGEQRKLLEEFVSRYHPTQKEGKQPA